MAAGRLARALLRSLILLLSSGMTAEAEARLAVVAAPPLVVVTLCRRQSVRRDDKRLRGQLRFFFFLTGRGTCVSLTDV